MAKNLLSTTVEAGSSASPCCITSNLTFIRCPSGISIRITWDKGGRVKAGSQLFRVDGETCRVDTETWPSGAVRVTFAIPNKVVEKVQAMVDGEEWWPDWERPEMDLLARARRGEYEPLIRHFELGGELTEKERQVLANIARSMFPRMGRPPETKTEIRNREMSDLATF
jgi:hypothetical protein